MPYHDLDERARRARPGAAGRGRSARRASAARSRASLLQRARRARRASTSSTAACGTSSSAETGFPGVWRPALRQVTMAPDLLSFARRVRDGTGDGSRSRPGVRPRRADREPAPLLWGLAAGLMAVASIVGLIARRTRRGIESDGGRRPAERLGVPDRHAARTGPPRRARRRAARRRSCAARCSCSAALLPSTAFRRGSRSGSRSRPIAQGWTCSSARHRAAERARRARHRRSDEQAGFSAAQQFWGAVLTSAPQPIGAVIAYLLVAEIGALLPLSLRSRPARCSRSWRSARGAGVHPPHVAERARRRGRRRAGDAGAQRCSGGVRNGLM